MNNPVVQAAYMKRRREQFNSFIKEYKETNSCVDCGNFYPWVAMDFDHVSGDKVYNVARMRYASPEAVWAEIAKCELVCSNCHRVRTYSRLAAGTETAVAANDMFNGSTPL